MRTFLPFRSPRSSSVFFAIGLLPFRLPNWASIGSACWFEEQSDDQGTNQAPANGANPICEPDEPGQKRATDRQQEREHQSEYDDHPRGEEDCLSCLHPPATRLAPLAATGPLAPELRPGHGHKHEHRRDDRNQTEADGPPLKRPEERPESRPVPVPDHRLGLRA